MVHSEEQARRQKEKKERRALAKENKAAGGAIKADLRIDNRSVTKQEFERDKLVSGTSQRSQADRDLEAEKAEALRVGFRERGDILTPDIRGQLVERTQAQEAQAPALEEAGVFEDRPTQPRDLISPIDTPEGVRQFKIAAGQELIERRFIEFGGETGVKGKIVTSINKIQDTVGAGIFVGKAAGDAFGDVAFVGALITGITGERSEVVQNVQSSLEARNQMATKIGTLVAEGSMDSAEGFRALAIMEQNLEADLHILQREAILSSAVRQSEEIIDIQNDLLELEQEIFDAKRLVAGGALQETDPARLLQRLDELEALNE